MKYSIIFILSVLFTINVTAQIRDSTSIKITYKFLIRDDSTLKKSIREDLIILEMGKKYSKCFSLYRSLNESILNDQFTEQQKKGAEKMSIDLSNFTKTGTTVNYYRNSSSNVITYTDQLFMDSYLVDDTVNMQWELQKDTITLVGYFCNKAHTTFRGRNYSAWYTTQIPMPFGPYKFGGLPGVILFIKEDKGNFDFQCVDIEILKQKQLLELDKIKQIKVNRLTHKKLVKHMIENPDAFAASQGFSVETISCTGCPPKVKPTFNPIELK